MTGAEIEAVTPWEIEMRLDGYAARMKTRRIFTASFLTAPIINGGMKAPKRAVTAKKLIPEDFRSGEPVTEEDILNIKALAEETERRRTGG